MTDTRFSQQKQHRESATIDASLGNWPLFTRLVVNLERYDDPWGPDLVFVELCGAYVARKVSLVVRAGGRIIVSHAPGWAGCIGLSAARHLRHSHAVQTRRKYGMQCCTRLETPYKDMLEHSMYATDRTGESKGCGEVFGLSRYFNNINTSSAGHLCFVIGPRYRIENRETRASDQSEIRQLLCTDRELIVALGLSMEDLYSAGIWDAVVAVHRDRSCSRWKGSNGHVIVVGGSAAYQYPPILSGKAALAVGADSVRAIVPRYLARAQSGDAQMHVAAMAGESLSFQDVRPIVDFTTKLISRRDLSTIVVLLGPGLGGVAGVESPAKSLVETLMRINVPLVIDGSLSGQLSGILQKAQSNTVLTPNYREYCEICGVPPTELLSADFLREWSSRNAVTTIVTGSVDAIASGGGPLLWCWHGSGMLSKNGTGDILAGVVAGLIGRGIIPRVAAVAATALLGLTGERVERLAGGNGTLEELLRGMKGLFAEVERRGDSLVNGFQGDLIGSVQRMCK